MAVAMASRATHSASGGGGSPRHLLELSHDELGVIVDGLADPLQPIVAVALSSTCLGLRTPLQATLEVLRPQHARAKALCRKLGMLACSELSAAPEVVQPGRWLWYLRPLHDQQLTTDDMATLGMLLDKYLPSLRILRLGENGFGDAGVQALCEALGRGAAPSLVELNLEGNQLGPAGAEALAGALRRGALPKLARLRLRGNLIGDQGVAALSPLLRKLPGLSHLDLSCCGMSDKGVASLVADLGKDDFKALEWLPFFSYDITNTGVATIQAVIDAGGMPMLLDHNAVFLHYTSASASAIHAVNDALKKRRSQFQSLGSRLCSSCGASRSACTTAHGIHGW